MLFILCSLMACSLVAPTARAATRSVTNTDDSGAGSLRDTIIAAGAGDTINFSAGLTGTITLTSGQLPVDKNLTIEGPGAAMLAISGDNARRAFAISSGVTATISGLSIRNGNNSDNAGGILNRGTLTLSDSILSGNAASNYGGGITNLGILTLSHSTLSGNTSGFEGGGIYNLGTLTVNDSTLSGNTAGYGGGIYSNTDLSTPTNIRNSTLSGNTATIRGGGLFNFDGLSVIESSTITLNSAPGGSGGGVASYGDSVTRTEVQNSLVSGNSGSDVDFTSLSTNTFESSGHNLIGSGNALAAFGTSGDQTGINDARLGSLQYNGGPTPTHALLYGSPAIDAGAADDITAPTDQRGVLRPVGGADDIGAFEAQPAFSISGYIRAGNVTPVAGVSVQLSSTSGPVGAPVTTDANGFYQISGLFGGNYLVTPTLSGWNFTPAVQSLVVTNANRGANFIAVRKAASYRVSGRISSSSGAALPGVSVALAPEAGGITNPVITNSAGYYTFTNVPEGAYEITASKSGYTFSPVSRDIGVSGSDITGQNFIGRSGQLVYGRIATSSGSGISDVEVLLSGRSTPVLTNSAGYYTLRDVPNGSYTVTPSLSGYTFTPASKSVTVNGADITGQNFMGSGP